MIEYYISLEESLVTDLPVLTCAALAELACRSGCVRVIRDLNHKTLEYLPQVS